MTQYRYECPTCGALLRSGPIADYSDAEWQGAINEHVASHTTIPTTLPLSPLMEGGEMRTGGTK